MSFFHPLLPRACVAALLPLAAGAIAQDAGWQACAAVGPAAERLACFDRWAESQRGAAPVAPPAAASATQSPPAAPLQPIPAAAVAAVPPPVVTGPWRNLRLTELDGCHDTGYSPLSRFWELEPGASCGRFGIRGFRPVTMAAVGADTVNRQPGSGNPANAATTSTDYRTTEARVQVSVRTKVAEGLLARVTDAVAGDSLWVAYSQQSYWQLFTPGLSRPFRSTDHEPEVIYVLPLQSAREGSWRLRYGGMGLVHQSNGQSLPYSRSWNRAYLMAGAEKGPFQLTARLWKRLHEDAVDDDNPGISDFVGRGEIRGSWQLNPDHMLAATLRHSLSNANRGSMRLEWFRTLGTEGASFGGLQLHTQLFTGYGDSLLDYNRRRTVFSVGLSLVEW